ncbi:SiaC family regulatory phosphoprotein domain-containing protein [uncultured Thiomicrorhabdus sp.]
MERLSITATQYTPEISMDPAGMITITGKSYPENTFEFYTPVMEWLESYFNGHAMPTTVVNMEIIYFNSSSSKLFFDFFDVLDENNDHCDIQINWIYDEENESAQEAGEDFIDDFENLSIHLVVKGK